MSYTTLLWEPDDGILRLTLNRPERLNAFTVEMCGELIDAYARASADDGVRAIVVTGAGKAFCAGMDLGVEGNVFGLDETLPAPTLAELHARRDDPAMVHGVRDTGGRVALAMLDCLKPIVGAVNGVAVGIGSTMLLPMDFRLAAESARFGFVFGRLGITPEACSTWLLPRIVGVEQALLWCYTADVFPAQEALAAGLVRSLHAPATLVDDAVAFARRLVAGRSPVATALTRQMLLRNPALASPMDAHLIESLAVFHAQAADGGEGVRAFREKRDAPLRGACVRDAAVLAVARRMSAPSFEVIAHGFQFCEAPRVAADGSVLFSDLTGGGYHRAAPGGAVTTIVPDRPWIGGATLDRGDALVLGGKGGLVLHDAAGTRPLLDRIDGRPIVAVNDIEADVHGGIYGGTIDFAAVFERGETPSGGILFHLDPAGGVTVLRDDVVASNGIGFSPDGATLYHSESTLGIWAWGMREGRAAGPPALFAAADDCDGLAVDAEGGVWVAFWQEAVLRRYRPDATIDRVVPLPFPNLVSLAFGGPELADLYVTTGASPAQPDAGGVIRIRPGIPGLPTHRSAFAT